MNEIRNYSMDWVRSFMFTNEGGEGEEKAKEEEGTENNKSQQ